MFHKKRIEMAYIASVLFTLISVFQLVLRAGKDHGLSSIQWMFWGGTALIGWLPSLWFVLKNRKRKNEVIKGKAMGVLARCISKKHYGEGRRRRYQYRFSTEFCEEGITEYSERIGGTIKEGDEFYIIKVGKKDVFFAKL